MSLKTTRLSFIMALLLASSVRADMIRLGNSVRPEFQEISLKLDARLDTYEGSTRIDLKVDNSAAAFRLHAEAIDIESLKLFAAKDPVPCRYRMEDSATVLVTPASPLKKGSYSLEVTFTNNFDRSAKGLFKAEVEGESYLFTQFEEDDAREAIPCFDEPGFKFPYQMVLTVPEAHLAISNTPIESEELKDGWRTVRFRKTPPLPSYLLAIATGPFDTVTIPGMGVPGRVVATKGKAGLTSMAVEEAPPLLKALENYFGSPYPFEKLDLIAVPEFWPGAMENAGAITFSEGVLLVDPKQAGVSDRRRMASVMTHEFAHMWVGDLVTMAWWDDLWLNESFAEWLAGKITAQVHPEFGLDVSAAQSIGRTMNSDARPSALAIRQPVYSTADLTGNLGPVYSKGQAVLDMFEHWLGAEEFQKGIRAYLQSRAWSNATSDDLWKALDKETGRKVSAAMSTFINQPGIPLVTVETDKSGRIQLHQKRFSNYGVEMPASTLWQIPLTLRYADGHQVREQKLLLTAPDMTVDMGTDGPPLWVLPNSEARGYCRWNVPYEMMLAMAKGADTTLSTREKVGYLGNLSALLDAGLLAGDEYLELVSGFRDDTHAQVISAVVGSLSNVRGAFVTDSLRPLFAPYVRYTLGPALKWVGLEKKADEDVTVTQLRPRLLDWLADDGQDSTIVAYAVSMFDRYQTGTGTVDPDLVSLSIGMACRHGDRELFDMCKSRFEASHTPAERDDFLSALGAFHDPALQDEALKYTLEGPLRPQEVLDIPSGIAMQSDAENERMFNWVTEHYDVLSTKVPPMYRSYLPLMAGGCSLSRLDRAKAFFSEEAHKVPGIESRLARLSDAVNDCVTLRQREGDKVAQYLARVTEGGASMGQVGSPKGMH